MKPIRLDRDSSALDIVSYGRAGPGQRLSLTSAQIDTIRRTVARTPEVMVKVSGGGGSSSCRGVAAHFNYIGRAGELEIEMDDGERLIGPEAGQQLINQWDLDLDKDRRQPSLFAINRRAPPKLVHKVIFSMPAGTPPGKVLGAVRDFAREEFGLRHRYAMVLHTDEPHPHVHVVVKAVSETGARLNIRKETLRHWRREFARQLRARGVEANATERIVRGQSRQPKLDAIFRAAQRGESSHMAAQVRAVARELNAGSLDQIGAARLQQTRADVLQGWQTVRDLLVVEGRHKLADQVSRFVDQMPPPRTEKQALAFELMKRVRRMRTSEKTLAC